MVKLLYVSLMSSLMDPYEMLGDRGAPYASLGITVISE